MEILSFIQKRYLLTLNVYGFDFHDNEDQLAILDQLVIFQNALGELEYEQGASLKFNFKSVDIVSTSLKRGVEYCRKHNGISILMDHESFHFGFFFRENRDYEYVQIEEIKRYLLKNSLIGKK